MSSGDGVHPHCYNGGDWNLCDHPGWRHPESWEEVDEALAGGLEVIDEDGDSIDHLGDRQFDDKCAVWEDGTMYIFFLNQTMIQGAEPEIDPADEQAALASIADAYRNLDN